MPGRATLGPGGYEGSSADPGRGGCPQECFALMDTDGSGAIDAEELHEAFLVMGLKAPKEEVMATLQEASGAGREGGGHPENVMSAEIEFPEFVEVMTTKLARAAEENRSQDVTKHGLPFSLLAASYRRKKVMEGLMYDKGGMRAKLLAQRGLDGGSTTNWTRPTSLHQSIWEQLQDLEEAQEMDADLLSKRRRRRASMAFHDGIDPREVLEINGGADGGGGHPQTSGSARRSTQSKKSLEEEQYMNARNEVRSELYPLFEQFEPRTFLPGAQTLREMCTERGTSMERAAETQSSSTGRRRRTRKADAQGSILGTSPGEVSVQERLSQQKMRPNAQAVKIKLVAQQMVRETECQMWGTGVGGMSGGGGVHPGRVPGDIAN